MITNMPLDDIVLEEQYIGIAYLYTQIIRGSHVKRYKFKLVGDNGETLINGSEPYNSKQARKKTLDKYFPNFKQVEK